MFDASRCGCVLLLANILCLFSGWTSWYEHIQYFVALILCITSFYLESTQSTRLAECFSVVLLTVCLEATPCLVGFYILFGWKFRCCAQVSSERGLWARKAIPWGIWGSGPRVCRQTWVSGIWRWDLMKLKTSSESYLLRWKVFYIGIYFWGSSHTSSAIWDWMSRDI